MPTVVPEPPTKQPSEASMPPPPPCMVRNRWHACPELHKAMDGVTYIADHTRKEEDSTRVRYKINQSNRANHGGIFVKYKWLYKLFENSCDLQ